MNYGSVCSGIEAASVAWEPLGWKPTFFSEIDKFPSAVLAHHYPDVLNLGDITKHKGWQHDAIDLLIGGTPCQSFSIAGLRKGMDDPRGNLALVFLGLLDRTRPRWVVYENVPGLLSSNGGRDFGSFLAGLGELGYGWAYRVIDAQYCRVDGFGRAVPQRRRRVFVVGHLGDWRRAAAVLFERESLSGNLAPRREAGKTVAPTISARTQGGGGDKPHVLAPIAFPAEMSGTQCAATEDLSPTLSVTHGVAIAFSSKDHGADATENVAPTMRAMGHADSHQNGGGQLAIATPWAVRRLTPRECERLQGFPDDYTLIPYRKKFAADGPRYKALGNSMAVNVIRWIGRRIEMVDKI